MSDDGSVTLRHMRASDWEQVADIYRAGIATKNATFETEAPHWDAWDGDHLNVARVVAVPQSEPDRVLGWGALSPESGRCVYSGVAEISVYVAPEAQGRGVGRKILERLVAESEAHGIWTLTAGIFPENVASLRIHERCGFQLLGIRRGLGQMDGVWRDVAFLERRSSVVGVEAEDSGCSAGSEEQTSAPEDDSQTRTPSQGSRP